MAPKTEKPAEVEVQPVAEQPLQPVPERPQAPVAEESNAPVPPQATPVPLVELSPEDRAKTEEEARLAEANAQKPAGIEPAPGSIDEEAEAAIKAGKLKPGESLPARAVDVGRMGGAPIAQEGPRPVLAPSAELPTDFAQRLGVFEAALREIDERVVAVGRRMAAVLDGPYATDLDPQETGTKPSIEERVANLETKLKSWI